MKLLIIEDEQPLAEAIVDYLQREDYRCERASTYSDAAMKIAVYEYDCILLDLMLPGGTGLDLLRQIKREAPGTGVIIVSAKDSLDDKVEGLRLGADDYLPKPFHLAELGMRVFALMRRRCRADGNIISSGSLTIDLLQKRVAISGRKLELTKTEYELLLFLVENHRRVISKSALAEHISGDMADMMDDFNYIYAHIKNLKAKLAAAGLTNCIRTLYGAGYQWNVEE